MRPRSAPLTNRLRTFWPEPRPTRNAAAESKSNCDGAGTSFELGRRLSDRRGRLRFELVGELAAALRTIETLQVRDITERRAGGINRAAAGRIGDAAIHPGDISGEITARVRHVTRVDGADGSEWYRIGLEFLDLQPAMRKSSVVCPGNGLEHSAES